MPNTTVQAAGEAMPKITRRFILGGMAVMAAPLPALAAAPAEPAFDLRNWIETADPRDVAEYLGRQLAITMGKVSPTRSWRTAIDHEHNFALIVGDERKGAGQ